ncbi:hypothetical protein BUALT_Bualt09G0035000 [Buddleja alternifolia]|uniref:Uncharacterized protein n=1 Tax=Buddleja alternifolia TaxID=168488 RepID=A0AAV6WYZ2_9LAMI|nr:hypothetical protein BUALT_Bualt09G0035000 [Buddleja alternifolia]
MAESKPDASSNSSSEKDVKAPNVLERAKEEFEAISHNDKHKHHHHHHKETHGLRHDIDANTEMSDVKAPNVFQRAKEEIEAILEAIHPKKESKSLGDSTTKTKKDCLKSESHSEKNVKAKEENESVTHKPHHHHKETHGTSDDIDENTPIREVKGPNLFERAKEEIEALIHTIHPKKDSGDAVSSSKD